MQNKKINIAVVSGGFSNERGVSLKTGAQIFNNLQDDKYNKFFVEITSKGRWLIKDSNLFLSQKSKKQKNTVLAIMHSEKGLAKNNLDKFDVIFIALHGKYGEDGKIQAIFDLMNIPYTGSGVLASAIGMNKLMALSFLKKFGIKTARYIILDKKDNTSFENINKIISKSFGYPCVIKPNESGSSVGVSIIDSFTELEKAIKKAFEEDRIILVEEYIKGREITCGVLGNARQAKLELLPPVEIISAHRFFDYVSKYSSKKTKEICPAEISPKLTKKVQNLSKKIHKILGCVGLTRSDFILSGNDFYFLEINTLPGLTEQSLCPKEAKAAGISFPEFLDKQVQLALEK